jgi:hypothetical protein
MKVYLVWQHEPYTSGLLISIYADKQQAENMCVAYEDEEFSDIWYSVEEREVID